MASALGRRMHASTIVAVGLALATLCPGQTRQWNNPASGWWNTAASWTPADVPDTTAEAALVPAELGPTTVELNISPSINWLDLQTGKLWLHGLSITTSAGLTNRGLIRVDTGSSTIAGSLTTMAGAEIWIHNNHRLTLTGPTVTNDGLLWINYEGALWPGQLQFDGNVTLGGGGEVLLYGGGDYAQLNTGGTFVLTQAAEHTIHGAGKVNAALVNAGQVIADVSAESLELRGLAKTNENEMKAVDGAALDIYVPVTQGAGGQIIADGGTVNLYGGATITGGTLASTGSSAFLARGSVTLTGVTFAPGTRYTVYNNTKTTYASTSLVNEGTVWINDTGTSWAAQLQFDANTTLSGTGEVVLYGGGDYAQLNTGGAFVLTQAAEHTIHGAGKINAALINQGDVIADVSGQSLQFNPTGTGITNAGLIEVAPGSNLTINTANLFRQTDGEMIVAGQLQVNNGPLNLQGGTLRGSGTVTGSVSSTAATVAPGASAGTLTVTSNYTQGADGALAIELGGPDPGTGYDRLAVTGTATLAGELNVSALDGFVPALGQQFVILTAGTISGAFTTLTGPVNYRVVYNPHDVTLVIVTPPCTGDLNCDGQIGFGDINPFVMYLSNFANWLAAYPVCNPRNGDINGDGVYGQSTFADINPFVALMTQCGAGCTCAGPGNR